MPSNDNSGVRRQSTYWVAEGMDADGNPQTPSDPAFKLWSNTINTVEAEKSAEPQVETGIGHDIGQGTNRTPESHELTVSYNLQRAPEDASGNPQDPLAYGYKRDIDGRPVATLTYLNVLKREDILAKNTVHSKFITNGELSHPSGTDPGASPLAARTETYGRGGNPTEPAVSMNPGDSAVVTVESGMNFAKVRRYQFDQPGSSVYLHLQSSDSADTGVPVDIESVDGSTSETLSTDSADGTTAVATTSQYGTYRIHVGAEFSGTLQIYEDDGSGTDAPGSPAQLLAVVHGSGSYDAVEADRGVPMVGAGSFESASALNDSISALGTAGSWQGNPMAQRVMSTTITCTNNVEDAATAGSVTRDYHAGVRELTAEATVYGETEATDMFGDHIRLDEGELRVPTELGEFVIPRASVEEGGSTEKESGQAVMQVEVTFRALEPSDGSEPIQFVPN